jgi:hypothetical protein
VVENGQFTGEIKSELSQPEIEMGFFYTPGRKTTGYGVERLVVNDGDFPSFYAGYSYGLKDVMGGDFEYKKVQAFYAQPWNIGGFGRLFSTIEVGKTFGAVPLSLLNPIPGNQTYFSLFNSFTQLDYYEFVSDTYASLHLQHNFGGRIFSRVPLLRKLDLREVVGFRAVYGTISQENIDLNASNIVYRAPEDIYWEWSVGVGNIFRIFRLDFNFRGNYFDNPDARSFGVTGVFGFSF